MPNTASSPIDRSKRSRFETDEWDSDYERDEHDDRHPKRQAIPDPETKAPYFNTDDSLKSRIKKKVNVEAKQEETSTEETMSLRSLVNTKDAGSIIGKGGKNVNEVRELSAARITISEIVQGAYERILTVYGPVNAISKAYGLIGEKIISEHASSDDNKKGEKGITSIKLLIPDSRMGALIGKGGYVIKSIQEQSLARLNASEEPLPMSNERTITVQGTPSAIEQAVYLIADILMGRVVRQAPPVIEYQPTPANSGHTSNNNNMNNRHSYIDMNRSAIMMGYGGMMPMGGTPLPMSQFYYPNSSVMYGGMMMNPRQREYAVPNMMASQTQQIFIPNEMVGCIIGKRGSKINEIRQMSGSHIKIDNPQDEAGERLITVTGTPESNQIALYLLYSRLESEKSRLGLRQ